MMVVDVARFVTSNLPDVADLNPSAAKIKRWVPLFPVILRSENWALPEASVVTVRVPSRVPGPLDRPL